MPDYTQDMKSRFAVLGGAFFVVLAVLLVRLWSVQVLSGSEYAAQSENNRVRTVTTVAPRGRILDRNGVELVTNRSTLAVTVKRSVASDEEVLDRLSTVLEIPAAQIKERAASVKEAALAPRVVAIDVSMEKVAYLAEHQEDFPGVEVQSRSVRQYPQGELAAHVLGYTGEISDNEMAKPEFKDYDPTDTVGKAGAENSFESVLQGDRGTEVLEVDASGNPRRVIQQTDPVPGRDVVLTIDVKTQTVAEEALAQAMTDAHKQGYPNAKAGAIVALDVTNGDVIAMASAPTYDPSIFLGGISSKNWQSLTSTASEFPLNNRAISAQYPPASTFKAFTGLAGLQYDFTKQNTTYRCDGRWIEMGEQWEKYCWLRSGHGNETFMEGIRDSCDVVFYEIGYATYKDGDEDIQKMAREFGYGEKTGIDLPGETAGRVPDAAWKKKYNADYPEYQMWLPGDTVNLAIGQGDMLSTPLQVAASYAGIVNDGKVMRPHIMAEVLDGDGKPVRTAEPEVLHSPEVSASNLDIMRKALNSVNSEGTGRSAFRGFDASSGGKTGTAEINGKDNMAWYVGYAPADNPRYAVAVVIEQGGGGGAVAAPAARQVLAQLLDLPVEHVTATDRSR